MRVNLIIGRKQKMNEIKLKKFKKELKSVAVKYGLEILENCLYCGEKDTSRIVKYDRKMIDETLYYFTFIYAEKD